MYYEDSFFPSNFEMYQFSYPKVVKGTDSIEISLSVQ